MRKIDRINLNKLLNTKEKELRSKIIQNKFWKIKYKNTNMKLKSKEKLRIF
jgi:hypothetical protein